MYIKTIDKLEKQKKYLERLNQHREYSKSLMQRNDKRLLEKYREELAESSVSDKDSIIKSIDYYLTTKKK